MNKRKKKNNTRQVRDLGYNKMCGIAGILSKKYENVAPLIGPMLSCIASRGPDGAGIALITLLSSQIHQRMWITIGFMEAVSWVI